jgi:hypothetical protein
MTSCAIMQPTYLPWSGYFHLANKVDTFVFLDDVQFERRSWQSRNRILANGQEHILSVPVTQSPQDTLISDIKLSQDQPWRKKHLRTIQVSYPSIWKDTRVREQLISEFERPHQTLADLNIALITMFFKLFEIKCRTLRASELGCGGSRSQHLTEICRALKAHNYYSPIGSRAYLEEDNFEELSGISLNYSDFSPMPYSQGNNQEFVSSLSVIDVIGHGGLEFAKAYISKETIHEYQY